MKQAWLYVCGLILVVMISLGASPALGGSGSGPYYGTPSWDQTLPASARFMVLTNMNGAAVLDRETGLVWEKSPSTDTFDWESAQYAHCNSLSTGGRLGWRLPTIQELASLVDPSVPSPGPTLPSGHPFSNVQSAYYWSATTWANDTSFAWGVGFHNTVVDIFGKSARFPVWCVRGGQGVDPQ